MKYPVLMDFHGGCLHQDWEEFFDYEIENAIKYFIENSHHDERKKMVHEIDTAINNEIIDTPFLDRMGCSYAPEYGERTPLQWLQHLQESVRASV